MITAAVSTLNGRKLTDGVTNHDQEGRGIRIMLMPGARFWIVVVTKLIALKMVAKQNRPMLTSHKSVPSACPGPDSASALSGAYCVQPAPEGPPGTKNAAISIGNETSVVQNPAMFSRGNAISDVPSCSGGKKVPKPFCGTVESTKNTISVPCMVR